jgi:hypothetical protein
MGTRMRTVAVALAVVLVVPLIVATAALVYAATFDSSVSINYDRPNFEGQVSSERDRCERGRTVHVFKKRGGSDRLIGTDETNDNGFYSVNKPGAQGRFYATVERFEFGGYNNRHVCLGDTSGTIRVGNNNND